MPVLKQWPLKPESESFTSLLLDWFSLHGRTNLPWQNPRTPYAVWISEVMLQQTQVKTVVPYFLNFMNRFPDILSLAQASEDEVLAYWSGLGYYSRGRNLHKAAQVLLKHFKATLPSDLTALMGLPGIGASTAAAIASLAFNQPTAILDGNVKRVLSRFFMIDGLPQQAHTQKKLMHFANQCMHQSRCADYTQAIMDLGATVCTPKKPKCSLCPLQLHCQAYNSHVVENYPQKAIKKALPHKLQLFPLIYTDDGKIYLEKRPSKGIWGGLWCLPWLEIEDNPELYVQNQLGLTLIKNSIPLLNLKHTFTHFQLHIHACLIQTLDSTDAKNSGRFFHHSTIHQLGLAKPTSILIECFLNGHVLKSEPQKLHLLDQL